MAVQVEVVPRVGVILEGKTIRLESTKADVEQLLGSGESARWNSLYFFDSELRVDFDEEGCVEFIELLGGPDGKLQPVVFGMDAFRADPEAVAGLLEEKNNGDVIDGKKSHCLQFLRLSVGLYRESVPENVTDMVAEAEADGHPLSEEEIENEKRRTHWAAIGIGAEDYYM